MIHSSNHQLSMRLAVCGLIVFLISCALTLDDYFSYPMDGRHILITERKDQLDYWGMDILSFVFSIFLFVYAIRVYMGRDDNC